MSNRARRKAAAQQRARRRNVLVAGGLVAAVLAITIGGLIAANGGGDDGDRPRLVLDEYSITGDLEVPAGEVTFDVANEGAIGHNVGVRGGPITTNLAAGAETTLEVELAPGTYELYCDISGHVEQGMVATLTVTG